ncbi:uncharacterized protein LOC144784466 [Lissotriton helveticus]
MQPALCLALFSNTNHRQKIPFYEQEQHVTQSRHHHHQDFKFQPARWSTAANRMSCNRRNRNWKRSQTIVWRETGSLENRKRIRD